MPTFASEVDRLRDELGVLTDRNQGLERWRALMKAKGVAVGESDWAAAKACGCGGCETCRPDLAAIAKMLDVPVLNVLILCKEAEAQVIDRALELVRPGSSRAQRRVSDRAKQKRSKKDRLAELRRQADPEYRLHGDTATSVDVERDLAELASGGQ